MGASCRDSQGRKDRNAGRNTVDLGRVWRACIAICEEPNNEDDGDGDEDEAGGLGRAGKKVTESHGDFIVF